MNKLKGFDSAKKLETFQPKLAYLNFDLVNKTIKIPPNLHIIATMNTSDNSIYHMDTAFKRRWDWEFYDINSKTVAEPGIAFIIILKMKQTLKIRNILILFKKVKLFLLNLIITIFVGLKINKLVTILLRASRIKLAMR